MGQHSWAPWPAVARKRLNSAPPAPHEYADKCVTSVPERLELYGEARPQTADPPTPGPEKHQKSFRRVGESFLAGIRVAHKRLQEHSPPPIWRVPKIGKKRRFDTFFGQFSTFRKSQNAVIFEF